MAFPQVQQVGADGTVIGTSGTVTSTLVGASGNAVTVDPTTGAVLVDITGTPTVLIGSASTVTAGAAATATLNGVTGLFTYISGFEVTWQGNVALAIASGAVNTTGLSAQLTYMVTQTSSGGTLQVAYSPPLNAQSTGNSISVVLASIPSGALATVNVHGFRR